MASSHFPSGGGSSTVSTTSPITGDGSSGTPIGLSTPLSAANGGTGISSLGTGVATWLGTPSSANLASALTDETGTGAAVFANTPTLVTPVIGAATGTSVTLTNGSSTTPAFNFTTTTTAGMYLQSSTVLGVGVNSTNWIRFGANEIIDIQAGGQTTFRVGSAGIISKVNIAIGSDVGSSDVFIYRDAANILSQRNSTNAQVFRLYNTFTSSTSYERLDVDWQTTANVCLIGAQKGSGGGTARVMSIVYGGTSTPAISVPVTSGDITFGGTLAPTGYKSSDGSAGVTAGPFTAITAITVKNGLVTAITGT